MFTVDLSEIEQLATDWPSVTAALRAGVRRGVSKGVAEGAAEARAKHRFKNQSGDLERSIVGRVTGSSPTDHRGEIKATAKYASYVEEGTKAHEIRPRKARMLRFESGGAAVFARLVRHPGTSSSPFMGLAYLRCERVMIREIEVGIAQAQRIIDRV